VSGPTSTYRFQVSAGFDLHAVAATADYVAALGAHWLYLSPLLTAHPGSNHGYDVVDHAEVDPARGGPDGLAAASAAAREHGLGVLVDIVPNHVGVESATTSVWWCDVLQHGPSSRWAEAFDIDWAFGGGKLRLPVLGDEQHPELTIVDGELRYGELAFPLRPDGPDPARHSADEVHAAQHYELVNWRRADAELNYRRFFAVNTLAAVRVEVPWVFAESHAEIVRWVRAGLVDGLRVDHPDGLADPGGYLDALAAATGASYVIVEKILHPGERLPSSWATDGTTGYDALGEIDRVLVDPAGQAALDALDAGLREADEPAAWPDLIHATKRAVADGILHSEVRRIVRELPPIAGHGVAALEDAVGELLTCFPVYRSYLPIGAHHLDDALAAARRWRPDLDEVLTAVLGALGDPQQAAARRFQQTSGMVMAKGVEDTAFYRYTRLGSLTEVGGDPSQFAIDVADFHKLQQQRLAEAPRSMTTLSTHDTKRGEDVRARLDVLSELPDAWVEFLGDVRAAAPIDDGHFEQLLWQAVVGAWPASRERLHAYAEKAAREAGRSTTWAAPNDEFERAMHAAIDRVFDDPAVADLVGRFVTKIAVPGWSNSLAAKLLQLTGPGVPDVYQGSELWETSLVDPDNRRPVDFDHRRRLLAEIDAGRLPPVDATGAAKLLVTSRTLRLRRDRPEWFTRYAPVDVAGPSPAHVIAVDRGGVVVAVVRHPVRLARRGGWGDTAIATRSRAFVDVLTGRPHAGGMISAADLFERYPVALLAPAERGDGGVE
jgi:(1->4)-alpha-D-glucan 1-alpha-D-glucosylmutase